jgi:hypothetical protein
MHRALDALRPIEGPIPTRLLRPHQIAGMVKLGWAVEERERSRPGGPYLPGSRTVLRLFDGALWTGRKP